MKVNVMHRIGLIGIVVALGILEGCGSEQPKPAAVVQPVKKPDSVQSTNTPAAAPVAAAPYVYTYNPIGKRDPFRSPRDERLKPNEVGDCTEALCGFDVGQLTLVAVVTGDANPLAMVLDPQSRGHIVRRNMKVGRQGGRVTQILRDSITVTQLWTGPDGKVNPNPIVLKLKPDKDADPVMDLFTGRLIGK